MKKNFKGFTLVECIIALAILGIASLTMAQIYASVSQKNRTNHMVNTSLSNQMAYVEKYTDTEAYPIFFDSETDASGETISKPDSEADDASTTKKPPHVLHDADTGAKPPYVKVISSYTPGMTVTDPPEPQGEEYSYSADLFILKNRDHNDKDPDDGDDYVGDKESEFDLRYKYLKGHNNS